MRHDLTDAERLLWSLLRGKKIQFKFRRQQPIGPYIVDFINFDTRLIIEADGGQHAGSMHDRKRDHFLRTEGYYILRFWNNDILANPDGVYETIGAKLAALSPPPQPSPLQGEGVIRALTCLTVCEGNKNTSPLRGEVGAFAPGEGDGPHHEEGL